MMKRRSTVPRKKERLSNREIDRDLRAIYTDGDGEIPDLSRLDREKRHPIGNALLVLIGLFGAGLLAAWAGFFVFQHLAQASVGTVQLSIQGASNVMIGKEDVYVVHWNNQSTRSMEGSIRVTFPSDFVMVSSDPKSNNLEFPITSPTGNSGAISIRGRFAGNFGSHSSIQAIGSFRPSDERRAMIQSVASKEISYVDSVVSGTLLAPPKSLPGDAVRIAYRVENRGDQPLVHADVHLLLPPGFSVSAATSTNRTLNSSDAIFTLPDIPAGASSTVFTTGSFSASTNGTIPLHADVGITLGASRFIMASTDASLLVLAGDLALNLIANGSDSGVFVEPGEMLHVRFGYENTSPESITHASFRILFEPVASSTSVATSTKILDWAKIQFAASGTLSGDRIEWTEKKNPDIASILPHIDGAFEFQLPILENPDGTNLNYVFIGEATYHGVGGPSVTRTIRSEPVTIRFRSGFRLNAELRYFSEEGIQLGAGALPPVVGSSTTYRLMWNISKQSHELQNVVCHTTLGDGVTWTGNETVSAGLLKFDPTTKQLTWSINRLPESIKELDADSDVTFIPLPKNYGRLVNITSSTDCSAIDLATQSAATTTAEILTTELRTDTETKGKGVVKK